MDATQWILDRAQRVIADALRQAPEGDLQTVARHAAEELQARQLLRPESSLIPVYGTTPMVE